MNAAMKIALGLLVLLSVLAGVAKVMQTPQEVAFFAKAGLGAGPLIFLGVIQIAGGLLAFLQQFRTAGLGLMIAGFLISVAVIAMTGNMSFAAFSMLPVLFGCVLLFLEFKKRKTA